MLVAKRKVATGIAAPLRELRKERRLTQKQVGEALNITEGGYRSYERGESSPDIEDLPVLAAAMGVTTEDLLRRLGILTAQQVEDHEPSTHAAVDLTPHALDQLRSVLREELRAPRELPARPTGLHLVEEAPQQESPEYPQEPEEDADWIPEGFDDWITEMPVHDRLAAGPGFAETGEVISAPGRIARNPHMWAARVSGDCMEPEVRSGDTAIVDTANLEPRDGALVAVLTPEGELMVKRYETQTGVPTLTDNQGRSYRMDGVQIKGVVVSTMRNYR